MNYANYGSTFTLRTNAFDWISSGFIERAEETAVAARTREGHHHADFRGAVT